MTARQFAFAFYAAHAALVVIYLTTLLALFAAIRLMARDIRGWFTARPKPRPPRPAQPCHVRPIPPQDPALRGGAN